MLVITVLVAACASGGDLIIDDFESDTLEGWSGHNLKWVDGGPKGHEKQLFKLSINKDPKYVKQGAQSLRFECWAAEEEGYLLVAKQFSDELRKRLGEPGIAQNDTFTMWVYCKSGTGLIDMRLFAPGGKMVAAGLPINFEGWRQVTVTPADWRLEGLGKETAREIWDKLYLFYPYCIGKFEVFIDDMRFVSSKSLAKQAAASARPSLPDRKDTIYADFSRQKTSGLELLESDPKSSTVTIKDRKRCILLDGQAGSWRQLYLSADDEFLPAEGGPVAVTIEYFDHGTNAIWMRIQAEGKNRLYYTAPGTTNKSILNTQKGLWRKDVYYFPKAYFINADGKRDIGLMLKGKVYLASVTVRKFSPQAQKVWEEFYNGQMDEMAEGYSNLVVAQAYAMDEVRQVARATELLGVKADNAALNTGLKQVDEMVLGLYKKYQDMYYKTRPAYCEGNFSQQDKDKAVADYLDAAAKIKGRIDQLRQAALAALAGLDKQARAKHPWLAKLAFEFRSFEPIKPGDPIPMDVFGKRYLIGVPGTTNVRPSAVRAFGGIFTNRGRSSGFLPSYCKAEGKYDFSGLDENMEFEARQYGLRGTLYPVYAGWCWRWLPNWFRKKYGDAMLPQSHDGHLGKGGGNRFHPAFRKLWVDYATALGTHLKGNDNLFMAMFLGEAYNKVLRKPGDISATLEDGYSPMARKALRDHLQKEYKTIENLNKQWQTTYKDFGAIEPPVGVEKRRRLTPLIYEFEKLREDNWNELQNDVFEAYKKADPTHHMTSMGGSRSEFDPVTIDVSGCHSGGFGLSHHFPFSMIHYYSLNRLSGKPLICREYNIVADEGRMGIATTRSELRGISERGFWQTSAWGQSGALLFCVGAGEARDNILANDVGMSVIRWFAGNVPLMRDKWDRLSKVYTETKVPHFRVGYLRAEPEALSSNDGWARYGCVNFKEMHKAMFVQHYNLFFVDDRSLAAGTDTLDDYRVIILGQAHVQDGLQDRLLAWVKNGGTLMMGGGAGAYNKFGRYSGKILKETLGLTEVEYDPKKAAEIGVIRSAGREIDLKKQAKYFWYSKGKALKAGVKVLGTYTDGSPALLSASYGKGRVYTSLFPFGWNEEVTAVFMDWLKEVIPLPEATCDEPLVEPVLRQDKEGNRYLCIINVNWDKAVQPLFVLDGKYTNLVDLGLGSGIPVATKVRQGMTTFTRNLDPGEGTILWLGKRQETSQPDGKAKAAWVGYFAVEKKVVGCRKEGMALEVEIKVLAAMKADIENKKYAEAALKGQTIRRSIEQKSARAGADALLVLAKGLTGKIDASRHDAVSKARLHALRNMAEYAIGVDRNKAEFYLNMVRGQINLPELPVRTVEIDFQCPKAKSPVKVDGDLKEWGSVKEWQTISSSQAWHGNPDDDKDISVKFATMWDDAHLYIAIKATDDVVMNQAKEPSPLAHAQDSAEIHLNVLDDYGLPKEGGMGDGLPQPIYGPDDFQFLFDSYGEIFKPDTPLYNTLGVTWARRSKVAVRNTTAGYDMEIAIPWSSVFLKPIPGYTMGFTMSMNDCDHEGGKWEVQITYRGKQVCFNTEGWARVLLTE